MLVQLSYEEQIINALNRLTRVRGEHFLIGDQRRHAAIRAVLQPLYEQMADEQEALRRYYIFEKEIDGAEQLEREFGAPEVRGSSISEEVWLERVLREPARQVLGLEKERVCADCGGPPHFQGAADDHPYRAS